MKPNVALLPEEFVQRMPVDDSLRLRDAQHARVVLRERLRSDHVPVPHDLRAVVAQDETAVCDEPVQAFGAGPGEGRDLGGCGGEALGWVRLGDVAGVDPVEEAVGADGLEEGLDCGGAWEVGDEEAAVELRGDVCCAVRGVGDAAEVVGRELGFGSLGCLVQGRVR